MRQFLLRRRKLSFAIIIALPVLAPAHAQEEAEEPASLPEVLAEQNRAISLGAEPLRLELDFDEAALAGAGALDADARAIGVIVQLEAPLTPESKAELEASGATVEEHLGGTTYLLAVEPGQQLGETSGMLARMSVGGALLSPDAKILPGVFEEIEAPGELEAEAEAAEPSLTVEFLSVVGAEEARSVLEGRGFEVLEQLSPHSFAVRGGPEDAQGLAEIPSVKVVDGGPVPFLPLNATGRRNAESDLAQLFSLGGAAPTYGGVTGSGVRIGVADSGVDQAHDDFDAVTATGTAGTSRVYNPRPGSGGHGTHVASIVGGSGLNADANGHPAFSLRGHAPEAEIGDYAQMGSTYGNYHAAIVDDATDVSNHSYVQSFDGYSTAAKRLDEIVRGDASHDGDAIPARPQVWAAGNNGTGAQYGNEEGYYALFTSAKNTISVGSSDSRDDRTSDFSSLGPTFDGRIKPDIVAPGCNDSIRSPSRGILAASSGSQGYTGKCGTSMAAPVVSGIVGLMMEAHQNSSASGTTLYPSTYKALLVQTARDMVKTDAFPDREFNNPDTGSALLYHAGPDFATGYGLVDANAAVRATADPDRWRQAIAGRTGEVDTYCVDVPAGAGEIRATLAWDDEPGSTVTSITSTKLVNDLDLELVAPDGTVVRPWTLDPLPVSASPGDGAPDPITAADVVPARRDVDRRNNVEMANVPLPAAGEWKVRVRAFNLPNANAQPYSLASSHAFNQICRTGPIIVVPICERLPWVCRGRFERIPVEGFDWRRPVPVDEICKYVLDCPGCEGVRPGAYCPGWRMNMKNLPRDARVMVFDEAGRIVDRASGPEPSIIFDKRAPGAERFIVITDPRGRPYRQQPKPRIDGVRLEQ